MRKHGEDGLRNEDTLRKRVLFLCTGNSCRSQMAEGFVRALGGESWEAHSAGLDPQGVNPYAIKVMSEIGIDISGAKSKPIDPTILEQVDLVVTLCGSADEKCPAVPARVKREHWPLEDPARAVGSTEEVLQVFRRVRDEIRTRVEALLEHDKWGCADSLDFGRGCR